MRDERAVLIESIRKEIHCLWHDCSEGAGERFLAEPKDSYREIAERIVSASMSAGWGPKPKPLTADEVESIAIHSFREADMIAQAAGDRPLSWDGYEHKDWYRKRARWAVESEPMRSRGITMEGE